MSRQPYIWMIPPRYPQRKIGLYEKDRLPHYLSLKQGEPLGAVPPPIVRFPRATLRDLRPLACLANNARIPLVDPRLAQAMARLGAGDFELIETRVMTLDGESDEYRFVNVTNAVSCIDYDISMTRLMVTSAAIMGFDRLFFTTNCMEGHVFSRERDYHSFLLVSPEGRDALVSLKLPGLHFATADEYQPPRGAALGGTDTRH